MSLSGWYLINQPFSSFGWSSSTYWGQGLLAGESKIKKIHTHLKRHTHTQIQIHCRLMGLCCSKCSRRRWKKEHCQFESNSLSLSLFLYVCLCLFTIFCLFCHIRSRRAKKTQSAVKKKTFPFQYLKHKTHKHLHTQALRAVASFYFEIWHHLQHCVTTRQMFYQMLLSIMPVCVWASVCTIVSVWARPICFGECVLKLQRLCEIFFQWWLLKT